MTNKDVDHVPGRDMPALVRQFPQVRVIQHDGTLGPETWSMVNHRKGKDGDTMCELAGPHIGDGQPEARRKSVTSDRIVPDELVPVFERARAR